jgi:hypothetical protein
MHLKPQLPKENAGARFGKRALHGLRQRQEQEKAGLRYV